MKEIGEKFLKEHLKKRILEKCCLKYIKKSVTDLRTA